MFKGSACLEFGWGHSGAGMTVVSVASHESHGERSQLAVQRSVTQYYLLLVPFSFAGGWRGERRDTMEMPCLFVSLNHMTSGGHQARPVMFGVTFHLLHVVGESLGFFEQGSQERPWVFCSRGPLQMPTSPCPEQPVLSQASVCSPPRGPRPVVLEPGHPLAIPPGTAPPPRQALHGRGCWCPMPPLSPCSPPHLEQLPSPSFSSPVSPSVSGGVLIRWAVSEVLPTLVITLIPRVFLNTHDVTERGGIDRPQPLQIPSFPRSGHWQFSLGLLPPLWHQGAVTVDQGLVPNTSLAAGSPEPGGHSLESVPRAPFPDSPPSWLHVSSWAGGQRRVS